MSWQQPGIGDDVGDDGVPAQPVHQRQKRARCHDSPGPVNWLQPGFGADDRAAEPHPAAGIHPAAAQCIAA